MSSTKRAPLFNNTNDGEAGSGGTRKKSKQPPLSSILRDSDELWDRLYRYCNANPWEMLQKVGFVYKINRYHHPKIEDQTFDGTDEIRNHLIRHGIPNIEKLKQGDRLSMELWVRLAAVDRNKLTSARGNLRNVDEGDTSEQYKVRKLALDSDIAKLLMSYGFSRISHHLFQGLIDGVWVQGDFNQIRDKLRATNKIGDSKRRRQSININDALSLQLWAASSPSALPKFQGEAVDTNVAAPNDHGDEDAALDNDEQEDPDPPQGEELDEEENANAATVNEGGATIPADNDAVGATLQAVEAEIKELEAKVKKAYNEKVDLEAAIGSAREFKNKAAVIPELLEKAIEACDKSAKIGDEQSVDFFESEISRLESFDMAAIEQQLKDMEAAGRVAKRRYNRLHAKFQKKKEKFEFARGKMDEYRRALAALKE